MESAGKRRRQGLAIAFLDLRDSSPSLVQTRPKRKKVRLISTPATPSEEVRKNHLRPEISTKKKEIRRKGKESALPLPVPLASLAKNNNHPHSADGAITLYSSGGGDPHEISHVSQQLSSQSVSQQLSSQSVSQQLSSQSASQQLSSQSVSQQLSSQSVSQQLSSQSISQQLSSQSVISVHDSGVDGPPLVQPNVSSSMTLEPIGSEEDDDKVEPQLATPHLEGVGYHSSEDEEVANTSDFRPQHRTGVKARTVGNSKKEPVRNLPRTLIKNLFSLNCKQRVTRGAMDLIMKFSEECLKQTSKDLAMYSRHAGRRTVTVDDVVLLLHRQRAINGDKTFEYLVNTYLPMEYATQLFPSFSTASRK